MKRKRKSKNSIISTVICAVILAVFSIFYEDFEPFVSQFETPQKQINKSKLLEADYVKMHCKGEIEHVLNDKTRIDCLTDSYACEFDFAKKWYEGVGQALWYSEKTGKKPCLALILKTKEDYKYYNRAQELCDKQGIKLIEIKDKNLN